MQVEPGHISHDGSLSAILSLKAAVKELELPWKHVYNPKSSDLLGKYGIQGFPTKIVIDPQGKIVKTVIGEDPAFYTYLDELFK